MSSGRDPPGAAREPWPKVLASCVISCSFLGFCIWITVSTWLENRRPRTIQNADVIKEEREEGNEHEGRILSEFSAEWEEGPTGNVQGRSAWLWVANQGAKLQRVTVRLETFPGEVLFRRSDAAWFVRRDKTPIEVLTRRLSTWDKGETIAFEELRGIDYGPYPRKVQMLGTAEVEGKQWSIRRSWAGPRQ